MSIKVENLTHTYNSGTAFEKKAIDDLSFEIKDGDFVGLIGHTGSGKSTLIQHFNALLAPTSGKIYFNGEDINADKTKLKHFRTKIGLVFQYPEYQLFETTVFADVAFGPKNMGLSEEEIESRVKEALTIVGIDESVYESSPFELSGGQKRRAAIAGVLAMKPEVIILDEPTAGLDPKGRDEILNEIAKMHKILGITVILVSHSMEDVAKYVNRIIVMHNGKIKYSGTPEEIFGKAEELVEIGLDVPQITHVFKELKAQGIDVPDNIFTVDEAEKVLYDLLKQVEKC
ncbi:MAG: energy-coupling factor transporter ATPase [Firmicutes bacterium]|nr:energy-coupling factor transporter ATPase [Bacillota bacterium]